MFEKKTEELLLKSGWNEKRKIDISNNIKLLEDLGYEVFDAAKNFLEAFGELKFVLSYDFRGRMKEDIHSTKYDDIYYCYKDSYNYDEKAGEKTIPVCILHQGEYIVCISESGKFFVSEGMWAEDTEDFWNGILGEYQGGFLNWVDYKAGKEYKKSEYKNKKYLL